VRGGDDASIDAMTGPLRVKLVGRSPLPARAADFVRAVLSARRPRCWAPECHADMVLLLVC
jgi:hypothetical protein